MNIFANPQHIIFGRCCRLLARTLLSFTISFSANCCILWGALPKVRSKWIQWEYGDTSIDYVRPFQVWSERFGRARALPKCVTNFLNVYYYFYVIPKIKAKNVRIVRHMRVSSARKRASISVFDFGRCAQLIACSFAYTAELTLMNYIRLFSHLIAWRAKLHTQFYN